MSIARKASAINLWLRQIFPDREFFMRAQGQVRFIKVSSKLQITAAGIVAGALLVWAISMGMMAWSQYRSQSDLNSLNVREAKVASAEERVDAYREDMNAVAKDLAKRQSFLEDMVDSLPEDMKSGTADTEHASDEAAQETEKTARHISAAMPEATALARIEARQLAFVNRLTRFADDRASRAANAIRKLGLNPEAMMRSAGTQAMGGPLEELPVGMDGKVDPRFKKLGLSLARMNAMEEGLNSIPQVLPAQVEMLTSSYGLRRDPFTGVPAMHSGLDFRGPMGAPVYAAADGTVSFAGRKSGYGKVIEISHGNGLMTRYAHLSRFSVTEGQKIPAGSVIGGIGSTGRSTGPHLHFEVRINDRAVNPRPFLESAPDVLEKARSGKQQF
ncbi:MAG: M23 family metallopeptidase [Sphingomonadaceae bacterium]